MFILVLDAQLVLMGRCGSDARLAAKGESRMRLEIEENSIYHNVNIITNYWETNERKVLNLVSN